MGNCKLGPAQGRGYAMSLEVFLEFKQLTSAVFVERPNRFVVRCRLGDTDELVEAHLADPDG